MFEICWRFTSMAARCECSWVGIRVMYAWSREFQYHFLAATKQLYDWFSPSVRLSVCPSVTPFSPCSHHRIIMKFSGVITNDKSDVHAKDHGQRSKVKVTEVNTQFNRFRTVTPVLIHIWWWNDAYSLMMLRRGALLLPEASFGLRVLSLPACVCVCVCPCVRQSRVCPCDNSSTV